MKKVILLLISILALSILCSNEQQSANQKIKIDTIPLIGDFSGLKYRNVQTRKADTSHYVLYSHDFYNTFELYDRNNPNQTRDLKNEFNHNLLPSIYTLTFGASKAKNCLQIRNNLVTNAGKLGSKKELTLDNIQRRDKGFLAFFRLYVLNQDSSAELRVVLVEYNKLFNVENFWVTRPDLGEQDFVIVSYASDQLLIEGDSITLPLSYSPGQHPNPAYNLGWFRLRKNNTLDFIRLIEMYEPEEKRKILKTDLYNFFSSRQVFRVSDSLKVVYHMLPFLYSERNIINDSLKVNPNLFTGIDNFKAISDSTRSGSSNNLQLAYYQSVFSYRNQPLVVAYEFGQTSLALYTPNFKLRTKIYIKNQKPRDYDLFEDSLIFISRNGEPKPQLFIHEMKVSEILE